MSDKSTLSSDKTPTKGEDRTSLLKIIGKAIGLDITKISIPVKYNEPLSFLQKMMEYLQYTDLLEEASQSEDPCIRALFVAVFSISCFANTWRTVKPFNPLLGETFEYEDKGKQLRFLAEQVSHHPPIGTSHCETPNFIYFQTQEVKTKFLGNSLDVTPKGVAGVILKKWDECYTWSNIQTVVNNLILGKMWIDHFGKTSITVRKNTTGQLLPVNIHLNYKKCGWFGRGWRDVKGKILYNNNKVFQLSGKWNKEVYSTADPSFSKNINYSKIKFDDNNPHLIWKHNECKCREKRFSDYGWTKFTEKLKKINDEQLFSLPLSDSRLREDIFNLERGDIKAASKSKNELEIAQRNRKESLEKNNWIYKPKYFDFISSQKCYKYNDKYWSEKAKRMEENIKLNKKVSVQDAKKFWMIDSHETWYNIT